MSMVTPGPIAPVPFAAVPNATLFVGKNAVHVKAPETVCFRCAQGEHQKCIDNGGPVVCSCRRDRRHK